MDEVLIEPGRITRVTINRPDRRNALTVEAALALAEALRSAASSDSGGSQLLARPSPTDRPLLPPRPPARVVILTGAGTAFCAGGDFEELARLSKSGPEQAAEQLYGGYQGLIRTIREIEVPVIAAVNGPAMGAGMDLALACDLRIASSSAKFGQVWVKLGIIAGTGGAFWVTSLAGAARAAQMLLTGEAIDAPTALKWGLVNEVVAPESLLSRAEEVAEVIAANPPGAVAANKRALNEAIKPAYEAALEHARAAQAERFGSEEFRQALNRHIR